MKAKNIILIITLTFSINLFSQIKVDNLGHLGIGTLYPNPYHMCHIKGNLLLSTWPATPFYELTLKVGNGLPGTEIGSSVDNVAFWYGSLGFNQLSASDYNRISDSTLKTNIVDLDFGLKKIMNIRPVHYAIENNKLDEKGEVIKGFKNEFGFISQDIEKLFPEVKITNDLKGLKLMDYDQIIPITVKAIQEQQTEIDKLQKEIIDLKSLLLNIKETRTLNENNTLIETVLYQNKPNPFKENTVISYSINDDDFSNGSILIFDMNGLLLKTIRLEQSGLGEVKINGGEFKPGMYIYSMIINDKEIDSKRMILLAN